MKKLKRIPKFKNEEQEHKFWQAHNSTAYTDWSKAKPVAFANLKPTSRSISIRIPEHILIRLKIKANSLHIPYQTLIKQYVAKGAMQNLTKWGQ